jgi:geranylgeranyl diphosphate synthase type II
VFIDGALIGTFFPQDGLFWPNKMLRGETSEWLNWYEGMRGRTDRVIRTRFATIAERIGPHSRLAEAVRYSMELPGKRFRPVLTLECCRVCGGAEERAVAAAMALECIHTFSLIHDDLPAMDDDELRRGKPCNHKVFGEAGAILAGDWLAVHPFALLASEYSPELAGALVRTLAVGTLAMIEGQAADVEAEQRPPDARLLEYIHLHKTARLIETACRMGGLCAGASEAALEALGCYGRRLGLAFQITDDLLDATGSTDALGKRAGKDAVAGKQTYPAAHGIEASRAAARREYLAACEALEIFGPAADRLRQLAEYVITRDR